MELAGSLELAERSRPADWRRDMAVPGLVGQCPK